MRTAATKMSRAKVQRRKEIFLFFCDRKHGNKALKTSRTRKSTLVVIDDASQDAVKIHAGSEPGEFL
jgi:hypothetical protein